MLHLVDNIIEALSSFSQKVALSESAYNLFNALDYPIGKALVNDFEICEFIYFHCDRRIHFSNYEMDQLRYIKTYCELDRISCSGLKSVSQENYYSSIQLIAIDISSNEKDRSEHSFLLTKIINKIYEYPIIILFRANNNIMLSGQLFESVNDLESGEVYLSDWYSINNYTTEDLFRISEFSFINALYDKCISKDVYITLLYNFSRQYFTHTESIEYLLYECYYQEIDNFGVITNNYQTTSFSDRISIAERYHKLYGWDYVDENTLECKILSKEKIESLMIENGDEIVKGALNIEHKNGDEIGKDSSPIGILPDGLDQTILDNPIRLAKWIEKNYF